MSKLFINLAERFIEFVVEKYHGVVGHRNPILLPDLIGGLLGCRHLIFSKAGQIPGVVKFVYGSESNIDSIFSPSCWLLFEIMYGK
jgi:hypothetical protein